jgi:formamidopyrimidine-DNA glycosylase
LSPNGGGAESIPDDIFSGPAGPIPGDGDKTEPAPTVGEQELEVAEIKEEDLEIEDAIDEELAKEASAKPDDGSAHDEAAGSSKKRRVTSQGVCHVCGRNPVWTSERQRWYCEHCQRFL